MASYLDFSAPIFLTPTMPILSDICGNLLSQQEFAQLDYPEDGRVRLPPNPGIPSRMGSTGVSPSRTKGGNAVESVFSSEAVFVFDGGFMETFFDVPDSWRRRSKLRTRFQRLPATEGPRRRSGAFRRPPAEYRVAGTRRRDFRRSRMR